MSDSKNPAEPESSSMLPQSDQNAADAPQELNPAEAPPGAGENNANVAPKTSKDQRALEISENAVKYKRAADEPKHRKKSGWHDDIFASFRHASKLDIVLILCGGTASASVGALLPVFFLIFGNLLEEMSTTLDTSYYVKIMAWLGFGAFIAAWISTSCFEIVADRQSKAFKESYFKSIIRQEMAWYDQSNVASLASRMEANVASIRSGIGLKLSMLIQLSTVVVGAIAVGFIKSWKLTLVSAAAVPVVLGFGLLVGWAVRKQESDTMDSYASAGSVSEEAFMSIRTVVSLGIEGLMSQKYKSKLEEAERAALHATFWVALGLAGLMTSMFLMSSLALWYGGELLANSTEDALKVLTVPVDENDPSTWPKPEFSGASAITVFFCIFIGAFSLGQIINNVTALVKANTAAMDLEEVIGRTSAIDPLASGGRTDVKLDGDIEFKNVAFSYPSRPDRPIFTNLNLRIPAGKCVALVGGSGCGKSTILQLLQRVYDCDSGTITVGGIPTRDINVATLRRHLGVVSQEPRLFSTTVRKNIELGSPDPVTMEQVIAAAKEANADGFITRFPEGYETDCGAYGGQLSGGQKQRIAIARALIRRPNILIFDEATSALDTQSERVVQEALDALVQTSKATTLIVAHRLSTIQNADLIIVLEPSPQGATVAQQGTHHELMKDTSGLYYHLVSSQIVPTVEETEDDTKPQQVKREESEVDDIEAAAPNQTWRESMKHVGGSIARASRSLTHSPNFRTYRIILKHWAVVLLTLIAAACAGVIFPVFGYSFAHFISTYFSPDPQAIRDGVAKWALILVGLGFAQGIVDAIKIFGIDFCGYKVATALRERAFHQTVHQDIAFFDLTENNAGKLCSILSADVLDVKVGCTGNVVSVVQVFASFATGLIIAFCGEWRLALVILAFCVLLVPANVIEAKMGNPAPTHKVRHGDEVKGAPMIMNQATSGIRVVSAFGLEEVFIKSYVENIEKEQSTKVKEGLVLGLAYGFSQAVNFFVNCLALWYGGKLVAEEGVKSEVVTQTIFALTFAVSSVGQTVLFTTDSGKATAAGRRVYDLIDRPSEIDVRDSGGKVLSHETFKGEIDVDRINFTYPTRPDNRVYRNLTFSIKEGEAVALVGASGCGKSTIVQLVERFYDLKSTYKVKPVSQSEQGEPNKEAERVHISEGRILLDGDDLRELNVVSVRQQEGLVSQEPILFDMTIEENIAISKPGATQEEIREAAKLANAAGFISTFPAGYDTNVGSGGAQLSGGQKQRIAIARALIRKPRLLILDEATSALDVESEKIVQQTIDELLAAEKRSTIIIAHRLSTVRNADKIVVLTNEDKRGSRVAEVGTHDELMQIKGGLYRTLVGLANIRSE
ncbi:ATP-binding cassette protein subfamily B member 2, putative [Eimeria tenella]|uniref:ATP-binding cassette protein subfamily B member 2, putative n=1 Tax=Eimeria tenella TaxID=5802 RepID=U6KL33_EIMTE|nr:ATP-binding cassette protein subfamily B member 2, putative [Eimeria tenella]CDJ37521.1 ATP-binding cassette protein subfamily B member 2, putative [Eimeria tenella]|eukprot:XP_013228359.1 ATP-binding cassette protein subfamily B member 2, putative [Eimeria tenella]